MREEELAGRSTALAIDAGFKRAIVTVMDANVTALLTALILFYFGAGPVRGFAWTLSIGVVTSLFTAILMTQIIPKNTKFGFVRFSIPAAIVSVVLCIASLVSCFTLGLNFGIDFKGGTVVEAVWDKPINLAQVRERVGNMNLRDVGVQDFQEPNQAMIRFLPPEGADASASTSWRSLMTMPFSPDVPRSNPKNMSVSLRWLFAHDDHAQNVVIGDLVHIHRANALAVLHDNRPITQLHHVVN
eukprot:gene50268-61502_t